MIGKLSGKVEELDSESIILDVLGVGYVVYVNNKTKSKLTPCEVHTLFIIHSTYEGGERLYGFINKEEKDCAEILVKVQGISYKIALNLLNSFDPSEIRSAILNDERKLLCVFGVGEKLAGRIVTELRSVMLKFSPTINADAQKSRVLQDATSILVNLGYNSKHAFSVVHSIMNSNPHIEITELVQLALKAI